MYSFSSLPAICGGTLLQQAADRPVEAIFTDSRKALKSASALFFAIRGERHDGHDFIADLYRDGVRQFVVEEALERSAFPEANMLCVSSSLQALQSLAADRRQRLNVPVIAVTGSNGKTIIKEWLFQLLTRDHRLLKTPGSYNSQLGVPLSLWQLQPYHEMAIIEAGISRPGEMRRLREMIRPTLGIFANIGSAHDEGFSGIRQKIAEKCLLFESVETLIYCKDHSLIDSEIARMRIPALSWGTHPESHIRVEGRGNVFQVAWGKVQGSLALPFSDPASVENCFHCVAMMLHLQYDLATIQERLRTLRTIPMRLELKEGVGNSKLIDDTYNNDLAGLQVSLDFLDHQQSRTKKCLVLSDILQSGLEDREMVRSVAALVEQHAMDEVIGIGPALHAHADLFHVVAKTYPSTDAFLRSVNLENFANALILVKGARAFEFERIVERLQRKSHATKLEIDLGAIVHNLNVYRARLQGKTRIMAMVKALAYGSGSAEIASLLEYHKVDYLGVAFADEGVELRKNNITLPIMVMSPSEGTFHDLLAFGLEPEMYSFGILKALINFLQGRRCIVHIKLDSGMHRLGFNESEVDDLALLLAENRNLEVGSIFSHLAAADDPSQDQFSHQQAKRFADGADRIAEQLGYAPLRHLLNSAGAARFPEYHHDMVRLGIGLYGAEEFAGLDTSLEPAVSLKTRITQIREVGHGETVGYGRRGADAEDRRIATLSIGYADGYSRAFSNGIGKFLVHGKRAPVVGSVCMDMTMVDITGIDGAAEGDEVVVYGKELPIGEVASWIQTIPYEILTNTSDRVKRVFWAESI